MRKMGTAKLRRTEITPDLGSLRSSWKAVALVALALSSSARGALGGSPDSVRVDQAHMKASLAATQTDRYTVNEIKTPAGTVVREYVSAGRVFAVAWQGPFVPDMRQLLGTYFAQYSRGVSARRESTVGRRFLDIQTPGLVVQTAGHMRAYFGRAYDPTLLPAGVGPHDVR